MGHKLNRGIFIWLPYWYSQQLTALSLDEVRKMAAVGVAAGCKLLEKSNIKRLLDSVDTILCDCDGINSLIHFSIPLLK